MIEDDLAVSPAEAQNLVLVVVLKPRNGREPHSTAVQRRDEFVRPSHRDQHEIAVGRTRGNVLRRIPGLADTATTETPATVPLWRDDYSNLFRIVKW